MLEHALLAVGRDDRYPGSQAFADAILVREVHRSGMESGDLVVVEIRRDVGAGGRLARQRADPVAADAVAVEPGGVGVEVAAHRRQHQRLLAEQAEVVGDVRRAASPGVP